MDISENICYVGVNDHSVDLFEGQFPVPNGMAYNSYIVFGEKCAVLDTVDASFGEEWLGNIGSSLGARQPDYLIIQHMEPDHSANIEKFMCRYPQTVLVGNAKTFTMIGNFFRSLRLDSRTLEVKNGDVLDLGGHALHFIFAPMLHWPEVMVTYDENEKTLFSADAFGKFGALDIDEPWDDEARRYYFGIVGKYGAQAQALLKAASGLDIARICPLHGPVLCSGLTHYLGLYDVWSSYVPEENGVVIAYTSVYGNTRKAAITLAELLDKRGETAVAVDLARTDVSSSLALAFRYDRLVLATTTYNGGIFPFMREFIESLTERSYQNRTVAFIENGTWAPVCTRVMKTMLEKSKNITFAEQNVKIMSSLSRENIDELERLADELCGK